MPPWPTKSRDAVIAAIRRPAILRLQERAGRSGRGQADAHRRRDAPAAGRSGGDRPHPQGRRRKGPRHRHPGHGRGENGSIASGFDACRACADMKNVLVTGARNGWGAPSRSIWRGTAGTSRCITRLRRGRATADRRAKRAPKACKAASLLQGRSVARRRNRRAGGARGQANSARSPRSINCASLFENDDWQSATAQSWDEHIETNLRAPLVLSQKFARQLAARARAAASSTSSTSGC